MTEKREPRKGSAQYPPQGEMVGALAEVLEDQKAKAKARKEVKAPGPPKTGKFKASVLVILTGLSAYLWFGSPEWLSTADDYPVPVELQVAGARMEIYLNAIKIEDFKAREGRLPRSLAEVGEPQAEMEFEPLGTDGYRLATPGPDGIISYISSESLELFLGNALEIIGGVE